MPTTIVIDGFSSALKSPGFFAKIKNPSGRISGAAIQRTLLLIGTKSSAGSATPDTQIKDIPNDDAADTFFGAGSELAIMCYTARKVLAGTLGVKIQAACVTPGGSAAQAAATLTVNGSWSVTGTLKLRIANRVIEVTIVAGATTQATGEAIRDAINAIPRLPVSATSASGGSGAWVVTLTVKSTGLRGNDWALFQDKSAIPSGMTSVLAGGAALANDGIRFASGAAADDVTNLLATLGPGTYFTIGMGIRSASGVTDGNGARFRDYVAAKAGIGVQLYEQYVLGHNAAYADAQTMAKTTLNDIYAEVAWMQDSENHPSMIAAAVAALKHLKESQHPNRRYNGDALPGLAPHAAEGDRPLPSEVEIALNNGVSPITSDSINAKIVRLVQTKCLDGSNPDYRCTEPGQSRVPTRISEDLKLLWESEYSVENEYVKDDPGEGEKDPPKGIATPQLWNATIHGYLLDRQAENWITDVENNKPVTEYDPVGKHLQSQVDVVVLPLNHRAGMLIGQLGGV